MTSPSAEDFDSFRREVEDYQRQLQEDRVRNEGWPNRDKEIAWQLPTEGVCSPCRRSGRIPAPPHAIILLCPHPSTLFVPFNTQRGRLVAGPKYKADNSTFIDLLGLSQEATGKWLKLHGAAEQWLEACQKAVQLLTGDTGDEVTVLASLRAAIAEAEG